MLKKITYNQFVKLSSGKRYVVLYQEIDKNSTTPTAVYHQLNQPAAPSVLLEFAPHQEKAYAFIGLNPLASLSTSQGETTIQQGNTVTRCHHDPFECLKKLRQQLTCADPHPLTKFTASAIGYIGYDAIRYIENIPDPHRRVPTLPEIDLKFYQTSVTFDLMTQRIFVCHTVDVTMATPRQCYENGMRVITQLIEKIFAPKKPMHQQTAPTTDEFVVDVADKEYYDIIRKAKKYITAGDVFQVVTSRTFQKHYTGDAFAIYQALKKTNPAPYHFYLNNENCVLIGASPEKMVSVKHGEIHAVPLAGTTPRTKEKNAHSDRHSIAALIKNPKEVAEHIMLVDLARNDIGKVAAPKTVRVGALLQPLLFPNVIHLASDVYGHLRATCDVIDVLKATFPAGTLSGAPKIRAMELIDELEHSRREIYGGIIVVIDRDNQLDTCIIIRSALLKEGIISIRAGSGIVQDSDPYQEAMETRHKAERVMQAVSLAEQGAI